MVKNKHYQLDEKGRIYYEEGYPLMTIDIEQYAREREDMYNKINRNTTDIEVLKQRSYHECMHKIEIDSFGRHLSEVPLFRDKQTEHGMRIDHLDMKCIKLESVLQKFIDSIEDKINRMNMWLITTLGTLIISIVGLVFKEILTRSK